MSAERWDVVVIGAGFSGLVAARDLTKQGYRVLVIEGRDRPGGRTWFREFTGTDKCVEIGGTWISPEHMPSIMEEVERYSVELVEQSGVDNFAFVTGGERRAHAPIPPEEFGAAAHAIAALQAAMARTPNGNLIESEDYSDLDVPVSEWPPFQALPRASREFVFAWATMYSASAEHQVSVMHFSMMLAAFGGDLSALHYGLTHRFANGTRELVEALEGELVKKVRYSTRVTAIEQTEIVTIRTDVGEIQADRVVCTIPLNSLHRIEFTPPLTTQAAGKVKTGSFAKGLKSWSLCRNVPEGFFGLGWGIGLEWAMPIYHFEDGTALVCGFGFDASLLDPSDRGSVQAALEQYIPEVEVLAVDTHDWVNDEFSDGTAMIVDPGWITSGDYKAFSEPHDKVYFAGADHSVVWTGWIEGAVASGSKVATQVAKGLAAV